MTAKPIFPWLGGKRRLAKRILPMIPDHHCYVEPFCGAAAIFFAKPQSAVEVLNDINGDVTNLYRVLKHHLEEFLRQFRWALASREMYRWLQITPGETLTDIQRAARFYYLQKLSFGAKVVGQSFGTATTSRPGLNLMRIEEDLSEAHLRLAQVLVERLPWTEVVRRYDREHTFFFVDPPYWRTEGYGVEFGWDQYELLAQTACGIKGRMLITLNDHPDIRRLFRDFSTETAAIAYSVDGTKARKQASELLIKSWG